MPKRSFQLDESSVVLPRGTRVTLRTDLSGDDGYLHKTASLAVVRDVSHHTYTLETPSGRVLSAQRDQLAIARTDLLEDLGRRQWDYRRLEETVIYSSVVGSQAWGLANEHSDEDVRGCFVTPFEDFSGLWDTPDEIHHPNQESAYWEVGKLVEQGLRGDANTLETLWSPLRLRVEPLGERLIASRRMFVSMNILGSFGRYAQSQFKKIERSLVRDEAVRGILDALASGKIDSAEGAAEILMDFGLTGAAREAKSEVHAVCRSFFDRGLLPAADFGALVRAVKGGQVEQLTPKPFRPKNAYNLLRLLHSCISWLREGEPLIEVTGEIRKRLLAVKEKKVPVEDVVEEAKALAAEVDAAAQDSTLPEQPDYEAADRFLKDCRRESARVSVATVPSSRASSYSLAHDWAPALFPASLPPDVDTAACRRFLERYVKPGGEAYVPVIWIALTGSHTYGFASPDSDLDLKGVMVRPARELLGLRQASESVDFLGDWEGREVDLTLNDVGVCARLIASGNGNMFERFLGPMPILTSGVGSELADIARRNLSRRVSNHYLGFFKGKRRDAGLEAKAGNSTAKTLLYAYRVALTGTHLLESGELVTDVRPLAKQRGYPLVSDLIAVKFAAEKASVDAALSAQCTKDFDRLREELESARDSSVLPEEPAELSALEDFLVACRLSAP